MAPQAQANIEPPRPSANVHTGTTSDATQSASVIQPGYDSAATDFHDSINLANTSIPGAQSVGSDHEEEMPEDGNHQSAEAMDSSNTTMDAQAPLTGTGLQPENLGTLGQQGPATGISSDAVADLLKTISAGHFWDVSKQLSGENAAKLREPKQMLHKVIPDQDQAETDPEKDESLLEKIVMSVRHSSRDSSSSSDEASQSDSQSDTDKKKKDSSSLGGDKELLDQGDDDVIIVNEHSTDEGKDDDDGSCDWATKVECAEREWVVRFPNANPFVIPKWERTSDGWYKGEDCANPSEAAPNARYCPPQMGL